MSVPFWHGHVPPDEVQGKCLSILKVVRNVLPDLEAHLKLYLSAALLSSPADSVNKKTIFTCDMLINSVHISASKVHGQSDRG